MKSSLKKILCTTLAIGVVSAVTIGLVACNDDKGSYTALTAQADIFTELNASTADAGIMDFTMASYLLKTESSMANSLMIADIETEPEYYGIATRKPASGYSFLGDQINKALFALKDTKYAEIATRYGIDDCKLNLTYTAPTGEADMTEWNKVKDANKIVIGFTLNPPMALGQGTQTTGGFDTDLSKAVFDYINAQNDTNIQIEFKLIQWGQKEIEMSGKTIDCLWNGVTVTPERTAMWDMSMNYLLNRQAIVIKKSNAEKYTSLDSLKNAKLVAEDGSAGEDVAKDILGIKD